MIEKILKEINRLKKELNEYSASEALDYIEAYINTLSEEHASEDLEEEINRVDDWYPVELKYIQAIAHHFAEWQKKKDQETIELAEDHAMLAGMNKMKEEMMKDAVDGEYWDGSIYLDNRPTEYKDGDKVKIIIVKEN